MIYEPDEDYGAMQQKLGCVIINMSCNEYPAVKYFNKLKITLKEIKEIESKTVGKQDNTGWHKIRNHVSHLLTLKKCVNLM